MGLKFWAYFVFLHFLALIAVPAICLWWIDAHDRKQFLGYAEAFAATGFIVKGAAKDLGAEYGKLLRKR